jgi:hypothetical protein
MSAVATREPAAGRAERGSAEPPAQRLFEPRGPTLEDSILAAWRNLGSAERASCPVCAGEMSRSGACTRCGSELS